MTTHDQFHSDQCDEDSAIRMILEGTASETGDRFFSALVKNLARALHTHGAWITEFIEESQRLKACAFWLGGEFIPDYEYDIAGTPCEQVIKNKRFVHIPDRVVNLFQNDPDLKPDDAVSYAGTPLLDVHGRILGHLAVIDTRQMPREPRCLAIFRIFAARAAAELQRIRAEHEIEAREKKLAALVDSAMDAIIELDHKLNITRVNVAAETMFACKADQVTGQAFSLFISDESFDKLLHLTEEVKARPEDHKSLWISGGLTARSTSGEEFSAEATLACFDIMSEGFYTMVLRNVNDRLQAEEKIHHLTVHTEYLKEEIRSLHNFDEIIGHCEPVIQMMRDIEQVAETDTTVLVLGETGTGKELVARAIHSMSRRKDRPLVKVNCAAIPASLMESEFFGHEKGAFTGATMRRVGRFRLADRGTIFLDEIGDLPVDLQVKLLRVLQDGEFELVGSSETGKVDVRVIAATNRNLYEEVKTHKFREDLYYRLNVFPIEVPPLRVRGDDIANLASSFARKFSEKMGIPIKPLHPECITRLKAYTWPGNVRELQNVIERAVITSADGNINLNRSLPESFKVMPSNIDIRERNRDNQVYTKEELHELERNNLLMALESTGWKVSGRNGAARLLGINSSTLSSRMKALGIKRPE